MSKNEELIEIFKKSVSSTIKSIGKSKNLEINFEDENFFIEDNKINLANPKIETLTKNLINLNAYSMQIPFFQKKFH